MAGTNGKDIVQQWLNGLQGVPVAVKKQAFNDAMSFLSTKGVSDLNNLTEEQVGTLRNALGNYGLRAREWQKYYPQVPQSVASGRQNLTFNDMLGDLGLTGEESADPEALKKVQAWLAARPGYTPGAKTNSYLEQLKSKPTTVFSSSERVSDLKDSAKRQGDILRNALPAAAQSAATKPAVSQSVASGRQNLTFNDMLGDLGLTGEESADPEALKKVQAWLAARPGYTPGAKTNSYLEQLKSKPTEKKPAEKKPAEKKPAEKKPAEKKPAVPPPKKNQAPKPSAAGKGYKFKNKGLYKDAMRAYKAGGTTFVGNDGNAEFFNKYDVSKFTVSDVNQKTILNPNIVAALKQRF